RRHTRSDRDWSSDVCSSDLLLLFFAFFGWEAITHLSAEFRDPARDVPRATLISVGLVTTIYVGVSLAVVGTGTYGEPDLNRVARSEERRVGKECRSRWRRER